MLEYNYTIAIHFYRKAYFKVKITFYNCALEQNKQKWYNFVGALHYLAWGYFLQTPREIPTSNRSQCDDPRSSSSVLNILPHEE